MAPAAAASHTAQVDPVPAAGATAAGRARAPPAASMAPGPGLRLNLFGSWWSTAVTLALGYLLVRCGDRLHRMGLRQRGVDGPLQRRGRRRTAACRAAKGVGACWAVIDDKYRFILFGRYPYDEQWRPAICIVLFIGLYVVSAMRRFWRKNWG